MAGISIKVDMDLDGEVTGISLAGGSGRPLYLDRDEADSLLDQLAFLLRAGVLRGSDLNKGAPTVLQDDPAAYAS